MICKKRYTPTLQSAVVEGYRLNQASYRCSDCCGFHLTTTKTWEKGIKRLSIHDLNKLIGTMQGPWGFISTLAQKIKKDRDLKDKESLYSPREMVFGIKR